MVASLVPRGWLGSAAPTTIDLDQGWKAGHTAGHVLATTSPPKPALEEPGS